MVFSLERGKVYNGLTKKLVFTKYQAKNKVIFSRWKPEGIYQKKKKALNIVYLD